MRLDHLLSRGYGHSVMESPNPQESEPQPLPAGILARHPWLTFLFPFLVYMLMGMLEPQPPAAGDELLDDSASWMEFEVPYRYYPVVYTVKIGVTTLAMLFVLPGYRTFPLRMTLLGAMVGIVGGLVWIGLSELQLEHQILSRVGLDRWIEMGGRSAFNPIEEIGTSTVGAYLFLAIRFFGLVVVVPIIEEFFLRGFVMRYVMAEQWWKVPFGQVNTTAVVAGIALPVLYHPEMLAALVWFSGVTWLMIRTRSLWNCVLAHGLTNLILGVYVVASGHWWLM
ncbi:MAG: CAAX prenyl protease-related protein [Pirellulales bacterium]